MKKLASLFLAVLLVLSFVGCGQAADPKAEFLAAAEKTNALEYQDIKIDATLNMAALGMEIETPMNIRTIYKDGKIEALDSESHGMGQTTSTTYVDGTFYMEESGVKIKINAPLEGEIFEEAITSPELADIAEEDIESVAAGEKDADGNKTYNVVFKKDASNGFLADMLKTMTDEFGFEVSDITYTASVNSDGYVCNVALTAKLKMSMQDMKMAVYLAMETEYINPGQTFEITAPEDAADYIEFSTKELFGE